MNQDEGEGHPPDQIVGGQRHAEGCWYFPLQHAHHVAEGPENLAEKPHQHDRPVPQRIAGGDEVADPVDTHDHPHALPDEGISWLLHPGE
jgi:hypothetical protein